jgi:hypothetical protein
MYIISYTYSRKGSGIQEAEMKFRDGSIGYSSAFALFEPGLKS